jgi:hypothetical protein
MFTLSGNPAPCQGRYEPVLVTGRYEPGVTNRPVTSPASSCSWRRGKRPLSLRPYRPHPGRHVHRPQLCEHILRMTGCGRNQAGRTCVRAHWICVERQRRRDLWATHRKRFYRCSKLITGRHLTPRCFDPLPAISGSISPFCGAHGGRFVYAPKLSEEQRCPEACTTTRSSSTD